MDSLEAGMTSQDVVPRLFDHHPVHREDVKSDLNQNVLQKQTSADWFKCLNVIPLDSSPPRFHTFVTCMAKSVVRHPTLTSAGAVQSAESILICLMLLGVIQPPPSSSSSSGSFSLSSLSDWSADCSDVSDPPSSFCKQHNQTNQQQGHSPAAVGQSGSRMAAN